MHPCRTPFLICLWLQSTALHFYLCSFFSVLFLCLWQGQEALLRLIYVHQVLHFQKFFQSLTTLIIYGNIYVPLQNFWLMYGKGLLLLLAGYSSLKLYCTLGNNWIDNVCKRTLFICWFILEEISVLISYMIQSLSPGKIEK